jgi:aspartate/methionine/tyrosine aminotransferase
MFSSRLPTALAPNALALAVGRFRAAGTPFIDLTLTNPTAAGIPYPVSLLEELASPAALTYAPEPFGMRAAREAAARELSRPGGFSANISSDRVVLAASTSEAYSLLFKLLCNSGDEVLIPQPSYPLFDLLSSLDDVRAVPYRLQEHARWSIDRESIERALTPRTRAILVVSPNNPTGTLLSHDDALWLSTFSAARDIAVIADEVFADYRLSTQSATTTDFPSRDGLMFRLGGLSKSAGLPQVKLGWIGVGGSDALAAAALERLELICDTYLSVSTPVQVAAPSLIEGGAAVRAAILDRIRRNLATLRRLAALHPDVTLVAPEAGWSAVIQVPATEPEEQMVLRLLAERGVLVHPGYFFDFAHEAFLVLSLLPEEPQFAEGVARLLA